MEVITPHHPPSSAPKTTKKQPFNNGARNSAKTRSPFLRRLSGGSKTDTSSNHLQANCEICQIRRAGHVSCKPRMKLQRHGPTHRPEDYVKSSVLPNPLAGFLGERNKDTDNSSRS